MDKQLAQHRTQEQGSRIAAAAHLNYEFAMYRQTSVRWLAALPAGKYQSRQQRIPRKT
jgi:hypothetical protein